MNNQNVVDRTMLRLEIYMPRTLRPIYTVRVTDPITERQFSIDREIFTRPEGMPDLEWQKIQKKLLEESIGKVVLSLLHDTGKVSLP